ncbi:hypothetical protein H4R21_004234 [Coemansia helicoidea]|uniref:Uncharacterized protein n=1 Tax=Coemansia helicoidea TaxID=1286919 RepID=A0ACC1KYV2_9FUNG|nr:hypothetical protein H4R21_004234 [Coemansia helicoidea]
MGAAGHSVLDRLTVLCLVEELGVGKWSTVAEFLSGHDRQPAGRAPGYTQEECHAIYAAAVREYSGGPGQRPGADALRRAICGLKRRRLDEVRDALGRNARELAALASMADGAARDARVPEEKGAPSLAAAKSPQASAAGARERQGMAPAAASASVGVAERAGEAAAPAAPRSVAGNDADVEEHSGSSDDDHGAASDDESARPSPDIPDAVPKIAKTASGRVMSPEPVETPTSATEPSAHGHAHSAALRAGSSTAEEQQLKNWKKNVTMVWREISGHRYGGMFLSPIKSSDAPRYYEAIRKPLDLKTIKNRVRDEDITTTVEFYRDVMHMLLNALMYNAEDTEVHHMAMEILPDAQACVEQLLQAEAAVKQPSEGGGGGGGGSSSAVLVEERSASIGLSPRDEDHDGDDSDASAPARRRRRVASERVSRHLRA